MDGRVPRQLPRHFLRSDRLYSDRPVLSFPQQFTFPQPPPSVNDSYMSRIPLSKRAAELLGPPPEGPIDWDADRAPTQEACFGGSDANESVDGARARNSRNARASLVAALDQDDCDEVESKWNRKRWNTTLPKGPSPRRVTLDGTPRQDEQCTLPSSPVSRRKMRRMTKQHIKKTRLKQSTMIESLGIPTRCVEACGTKIMLILIRIKHLAGKRHNRWGSSGDPFAAGLSRSGKDEKVIVYIACDSNASST
jgi:hypothetical protein